MRKLLIAFLIISFFAACKKDRKAGVCYCKFFNGDKQEYDLTHLTRAQQIDTCNLHNSNAANFGGECELE